MERFNGVSEGVSGSSMIRDVSGDASYDQGHISGEIQEVFKRFRRGSIAWAEFQRDLVDFS